MVSVTPPNAVGGDVLLSTSAFTLSGRRARPESILPSAPLVIAIPGGGYGWRYFDLEGCSLLRRASALGIPVLALDRPGYGGSTPLGPAPTLMGNAERLNETIGALWTREGGEAAGVVLIGHSIGAAIAVVMAALQPRWPLLGLCISGIGLRSPPEVAGAWAALPDVPMIELPAAVKQAAMFGPAWTYSADAAARSMSADAPAPRSELIDIVGWWPEHVLDLAGRVTVPVHYRQGEYDSLWLVNGAEVRRFGEAFATAPEVDAQPYRAGGHCIDFHRLGAAFQLEQLAFALRCAGPQDNS